VINYDIPQDPENYVHRIGRTARAGKTGKAITLACDEYVFHLEPLETVLGYKIPVVWPEEEWFEEDRSRAEDLERPGRPGHRGDRRERGPGREREAGRGRARGRDGRDGRRKPARDEAPRKPKVKRIPGAFFGFGPPEPEEDPVVEVLAEETPAPAAEAAAPVADASEKPERPKKRRRRRRKKRSSAPESGSPPNGGDAPPPAEGALPEAPAEPAPPVIDSTD
jgi:ATP-dependent RNA helicase RhlB